ncbi:GNAT family N-acetyltransferase [Sandaracinobacteroides saxicola]|uniref:GNAT family N-acetyltransferase n=1 Tax=Sandaracinobacteroides saxicola TaxID=2759707 RepID=A0A7G5IEY6_9SPHN|nr:GNAT family protein [Sandaracinobacteroides saxicola]QMW21928.1 GNAT family N-acetyltransferase [Sandaracinobacteroides saxicola]
MSLPVLRHGDIRLEPLAEAHREGLRAACAADEAIWEMYSYSLFGLMFDINFDAILLASGQYWAILLDDDLIGCSALFPEARTPGVAEIGGTYYAPRVRGSGLNERVKWLMLRHAFASGFHRVELRVDERNTRSQAAVLKIGAVKEGVLRRHKISHTGFVRNTVVFAVTDQDWPAVEARLQAHRGKVETGFPH